MKYHYCNKIIFSRLKNLIIALGLPTIMFLASCSAERDIEEALMSTNEDKVTVTLSLEQEKSFDTRCYNGNWLVNNESDGYGSDGLIPHEEYGFMDGFSTFSLILYYDGEIIGSIIDARTGTMANPGIKKGDGINIYVYEDRIAVPLTFMKNQDPSKVKIYAEFNGYQHSGWEDGGDLNIKFHPCKLMAYQQLATSNNWDNVIPKMTLKRRTSEFYILTDEDFTYFHYRYIWGTSVLNSTTDFVYGISGHMTSNTTFYHPYSYDIQKYDYINDEVYCQSTNEVFPHLRYYTDNENYMTTFKGRKFRMIGGARALINDKGQFPIITNTLMDPVHSEPNNGQRLRYLIGRVSDNSDGEVYKVSIDLNNFEIKPNRKYVIVNKPGTKLFPGTRSLGSTRGVGESENILSIDDVEVYELPMDFTLSFDYEKDENQEYGSNS